MLGPSLLVAPVLDQGASTRSVYLPPGRWYEVRSGAIVDGPKTISVGVTLGALPTYVREGAILPRFDAGQWTDEKTSAIKYLDVYPSQAEARFTLYEDDGRSFAHAESDASARVTYSLTGTATGARLTASAKEGTYPLPPRTLLVRVHRVDHGVTGVTLGGQALSSFGDLDALLAAKTGYWYDDRDLALVVALPDQAGFDLGMSYDPKIDDLAPTVMMRFTVDVPAGTPTDPPIHIATDASGWTHAPLAWEPGNTRASGLVPVPRGGWVFYKYTRGGWGTVEKWPGCVEATNRYELGAAHPDKQDTVFGWADWCP
jgi:alpha-glucosidase